MNLPLVLIFLFGAGSLIGWEIELFYRRFLSKNNPDRRWINPGFLVGPCLPLYGSGLCGMYVVIYVCKDVLGWFTGNPVLNFELVFILMAVVMTIIEYIAGLIFIRHMKLKLWDYSDRKFNLQGIICPRFSIYWGLLGCVYYYVINPYVLNSIYWLSEHLTFSFFIGMFFGIFLIDVSYSLKLSYKLRAFAKEKEILIRYEELKQHIAQQREEMEEKSKFLLAFRTAGPLRDQLESYVENFKPLKPGFRVKR